MLPILRLLTTVLSRGGEPEKQPWEKGNSFLISAGISDITFAVTPLAYRNTQNTDNLTANITDIAFAVSQVYYRTGHNIENLVASITDLSFVVTKVGANPL